MRRVNTQTFYRAGLSLGMLALAAVALAQTVAEPEEAKGMNAFGKMIPLGFVNKNVVVPSFKDGKPSSLLTADTLTRLDEELLSAVNVVVEVYAEDPAATLRVDLKSAVYNMPDQIMRSGERSRVSRADFEMEGDSMVFDTAHSIGSMKGRVRTLIFDMNPAPGKAEGNPTNE
ncbi:hypothetical protein WJU23_17760 [Prosthecobacter sp. SYSU 5D2]|uniref:hypothetical protein n=1 Tax=Prosthecobacter sp. SYSU 5D2 TaxID=3134134 RepID=UPI0031FF391F